MISRLRSAWRALTTRQGINPTVPVCRRCAELAEAVTYWREREERTADALLLSKGIQGRVAAPPKASTPNPMASIARGMGITEIDSRKSKQPGQGAMTSGSDRDD